MTDTTIFEYKTAAYYTLGCKLNFAETSAIGRSLLAQGVRTAREGEQANICVINTCSVTELADKKCRYAIRKAKREHPDAFVIVTGCYAQLSPQEVSEIEGVNLVVGSEQKLDVVHILSSLPGLELSTKEIISSPIKDVRDFKTSVSSDERTRYFLKVQDGCDYHCSYCTIPKARGRSRNGSIAELVREAELIVERGGREIVLTGVNIGDFGRTTDETFLDLLQALDQVEGIVRYRIGSIEPNLLSDEIIDFCASSRKIAPHFHIPLQSGSDAVLSLMRRRYDTSLFTRRVEHIRRVLPDAFIGVDVIVGTRGETEEYFEESFRYVSGLPISQLHVFSYSERAGTSALRIPHSVDLRERHLRSQKMQRLSEELLHSFYHSQVGKAMRVLWEMGRTEDGMMTGWSDHYLRVAQPYNVAEVGQVSTLVARSYCQERGYLL